MLSKKENNIEPETHQAQRSSENKNIKVIDIGTCNALAAPWAMVIIILHTDITTSTMLIVSCAFRVN
jgi:hypothetical protein